MKNNSWTNNSEPGIIIAGPKIWLRLEGLCWFIASLYFFTLQDYSWKFFVILFFVPDISFTAYVFGTRIGAYCYNFMHAEVAPLILGLGGLMVDSPFSVTLATIWICHIGFDRMLGFGLKYTDDFKHTHLGFPFASNR